MPTGREMFPLTTICVPLPTNLVPRGFPTGLIVLIQALLCFSSQFSKRTKREFGVLKISCTRFRGLVQKSSKIKLVQRFRFQTEVIISFNSKFHVYLSSAIHIILVLLEVSCVFVVVFVSSVIQITFVFSILFKIITDTVWLLVTLHLTEILIDNANGTYHVIIQPGTMDWSTCESQIATVTWKQII